MTKPRLDQGPDYERGFIDGMQHQMQSSVDKAVNRMAQPEPPPECVTEAEKKAFAFGWWKAMEAQRLAQPEQKRPQNCGTGYCSCIECVMEPEQEPVAWASKSIIDWLKTSSENSYAITNIMKNAQDESYVPLYTTPPQRPWVGLTDEERETATGWSVEHIEDFLKQKNGYAEDKNT